MRTKLLSVLILVSFILASCTAAPTAAPAPVAAPVTVKETVVVQQTQIVNQTQVVEKVVEVTPTPGPNPEAVIPNVEPNATITFWTFWLSPTFDQYIKDTIARFNVAYPGVTVKWEDHQATFQDDLKNSFAAGNAPDVINLSVSEGWVSDYATQGKLLALDDKVPAAVKGLYFPGLWNEQLVNKVNY